MLWIGSGGVGIYSRTSTFERLDDSFMLNNRLLECHLIGLVISVLCCERLLTSSSA